MREGRGEEGGAFDNTCNDMRRCYEDSGIQAALKGMKNVEVRYMEEERYKKVKIKGTFPQGVGDLRRCPLRGRHHQRPHRQAPLPHAVDAGPEEHDGHHGGRQAAPIPQADRGRPGGPRPSTVKSHLVVIDATRILTAHGPTGGSLADVKVLNKVIASTDIVAA